MLSTSKYKSNRLNLGSTENSNYAINMLPTNWLQTIHPLSSSVKWPSSSYMSEVEVFIGSLSTQLNDINKNTNCMLYNHKSPVMEFNHIKKDKGQQNKTACGEAQSNTVQKKLNWSIGPWWLHLILSTLRPAPGNQRQTFSVVQALGKHWQCTEKWKWISQ